MTENTKAEETQGQTPKARGISPGWAVLAILLIALAGWVGWQAATRMQNVSGLQSQVTQLQADKAALATELVPVVEEWAKIAQVQVDLGNAAAAQASIQRAEKFLAMVEGLGGGVSLDPVKATVAQVKATLAGEQPPVGGTEAPAGTEAAPATGAAPATEAAPATGAAP